MLSRGHVLVGEAATALAPVAVPPPASTRPMAHVVPRETVEAHAEAAWILERARVKAEAIVLAADRAASSARERAEEEGRREGRAQLIAALLRVADEQALWRAGSEARILDVAGLLAERLVGRALQNEPSVIVDLAREALSSFSRARRATLIVHPDDVVALREGVASVGLSTAAIDIQSDPTRARGSVRADTDLGSFDADLAPQLDRLVAALKRP